VRIDRILSGSGPHFSFEFFPPKSDDAVQALLQTAAALQALGPAFVSVTYGAGGSTRARSLQVVKAIAQELRIEAMAHITCVGASKDDLRAVFRDVADAGIENVLALRGDPPRGSAHFEPPADGLAHATDLIALVQAEFQFCVGAACYPEVHPESLDANSDLLFLLKKQEAGAQFFITQLFFDNAYYFRFVKRARSVGVRVPVIPGIMPITNADQIERFTRLCGATLPLRLRTALQSRSGDPEAVAELGVAYATLQCVDLLAAGAPAIHFYTLNKSPASRAVVSALLAARPWERSPGLRYLGSPTTAPR